MSWSLTDYDFHLPEELIAKYPLADRSASRMMVIDRAKRTIEHRLFKDFSSYVHPENGDLVVLNNARVLPARVMANEGKLELLVLERRVVPVENSGGAGSQFVCLVRPGRKARIGTEVWIRAHRGVVEQILSDGERVLTFDAEVDLDALGSLPIPSYLKRDVEELDRERYQTVYARNEADAIAAPTAGLHFTPDVLAKLPHTFLTLAVGVGTFRPVRSEDIREHLMHSERFEISEEGAAEIQNCREGSGKLFAIGTTTVRVLEGSKKDEDGRVVAQRGSTNIFIHPPKKVEIVDVLLTNFHLPRSTLLMLISAFADREFILEAYRQAVAEKYRFFSYGDCMLIL